MTPRELLDAVDSLLTGQAAGRWPCWQRACAALLRIALEQVLCQYWQQRRPSVAGATTRTQLLVLPELAGAVAAETARSAWSGLCRAVHHHTYELAPTAAELRGWHRDVTRLLSELARPDSERAAVP